MNDWLNPCLVQLAWTTAAVSVSAVVAAIVLRGWRVQSVRIRRAAWLLVLLQGILAYKLPVELPLAPAADAPASSTAARHESGLIASDSEDDVELHLEDVAPTSPVLRRKKEATTPSALPWQAAVAGIWLLGVAVLLAQSVRRYAAFLRRLPHPLPSEGIWQDELAKTQERMNVRSRVTLHVTEQLGPAVCWSPGGYRLLVPRDLWQRLSPAARQSVLRHELAHVARGDLWSSLVARLLVLPQWFNPLAWRAVRRYEECAEWACDDLARGAESDEAFAYARTLLALGESEPASPALPHVAARGGAMTARIQRLLTPVPPKESIMKRIWIVSVMAAVSLLGLWQFRIVSADPPPTPGASEAAADDADASTSSFDSPEDAATFTKNTSQQASDVGDKTGANAVSQPAPSTFSGLGDNVTANQPSDSLPHEDSQIPSKASTSNGRGQDDKAPAANEAIIDMSRVFKQYRRFLARQEALKARVVAQEAGMREKEKLIEELKQRYLAETPRDSETVDTLRKTMALLTAELNASATSVRRELQLAEARMYHESYEEVRAEVARYAKEHGIRTVRKANTVVGDAREVDPTDRQAVLARLNREIVYSEPQYVDITEAILQRLNGEDSSGLK